MEIYYCENSDIFVASPICDCCRKVSIINALNMINNDLTDFKDRLEGK